MAAKSNAGWGTTVFFGTGPHVCVVYTGVLRSFCVGLWQKRDFFPAIDLLIYFDVLRARLQPTLSVCILPYFPHFPDGSCCAGWGCELWMAFTCCMLGNVSALMCLSIKSVYEQICAQISQLLSMFHRYHWYLNFFVLIVVLFLFFCNYSHQQLSRLKRLELWWKHQAMLEGELNQLLIVSGRVNDLLCCDRNKDPGVSICQWENTESNFTFLEQPKHLKFSI